MRYVLSRITYNAREETYRIFVTDGLRAVVGGNGMRYADLLKPQDTRTGEEIIDSIRAKMEG